MKAAKCVGGIKQFNGQGVRVAVKTIFVPCSM